VRAVAVDVADGHPDAAREAGGVGEEAGTEGAGPRVGNLHHRGAAGVGAEGHELARGEGRHRGRREGQQADEPEPSGRATSQAIHSGPPQSQGMPAAVQRSTRSFQVARSPGSALPPGWTTPSTGTTALLIAHWISGSCFRWSAIATGSLKSPACTVFTNW